MWKELIPDYISATEMIPIGLDIEEYTAEILGTFEPDGAIAESDELIENEPYGGSIEDIKNGIFIPSLLEGEWNNWNKTNINKTNELSGSTKITQEMLDNLYANDGRDDRKDR